MCTQAVGLVAAEMERQGISTVALQLLRIAAERVQPPRGLFMPYPHGYPLGKPGDPAGQRAVLEAALRLLEDESLKPPVLVDYPAPQADVEELMSAAVDHTRTLSLDEMKAG